MDLDKAKDCKDLDKADCKALALAQTATAAETQNSAEQYK
jgi:hypothetical protein